MLLRHVDVQMAYLCCLDILLGIYLGHRNLNSTTPACLEIFITVRTRLWVLLHNVIGLHGPNHSTLPCSLCSEHFQPEKLAPSNTTISLLTLDF
jgi:hypothetical protein